MKKHLKTILTLSLLLMNINNVYAKCSNEEILEFKKLDEQHKITYTFDKENKTYTVYAYIYDEEKYKTILSLNEEATCTTVDNKFACSNVTPGEHEYIIMSKNESCNEKLKEETIILPYNKLSEDEQCIGNEDFVLCNPTYNKKIEYDEFISRLETYKKTKKETPTNITTDKENSKTKEIFNTIKNFIIENIIIITLIILGISILILIINTIYKREKKRRRLE